MAVRAITLDLFDTLVDLDLEGLPRVDLGGRSIPSTAGALHDALVQECPGVDFDSFATAMRAVDRDFRQTHYANGRELPTVERFSELCVRLGVGVRDLPERLTQVHMGMLRGQASLPDHHPALLVSLADRVKLGLCSNFSHSPTALGILDDFGLRQPLTAIAISDAVGLRKPRSEIFEALLNELGVEPVEVLHVGDSLSADVAGAVGLGIRAVWLTRRVRDPKAALAAHEGPDPDHQIGDLSELGLLLESL